MDENMSASPPSGAGESGSAEPAHSRTSDVPKKLGFFEKILNIYIEPSSVFKNLYYHNDWVTPLVFGGVLTIIAGILNMNYSAEAQNAFRELMGTPLPEAAGAISQYVQLAFAPIGLLFAWLIAAAIVFVLGTFLLEHVDFIKLYSVVAFAWMPAVFTNLVNAIYKMGQTPVISSYDDYMDAMMPWTISLGRVLNGDGIFFSLASVIDVFTIWSYWLLFLGLIYAFRNKPKNAAVVTIIYVIFSLAFAAGMLALTAQFRPPGL